MWRVPQCGSADSCDVPYICSSLSAPFGRTRGPCPAMCPVMLENATHSGLQATVALGTDCGPRSSHSPASGHTMTPGTAQEALPGGQGWNLSYTVATRR